jgi:ubiquinone/menaquinone biosynthesis C-methylase UbiE
VVKTTLRPNAGDTASVSLFDGVVDEYDAARPAYPEDLFETLEPLQDALVVEGGCGTGIATRQLVRRGATVIGVDIGPNMLQRAIERSPELLAIRGDAARLPILDHCADLLCYAQSWHWVDEQLRVDEAHRVLHPDGRWAAWWSHARDDGEAWFDAYWDAIERTCPGTLRSQRDIDWAEDLVKSGLFTVDKPKVFPWMREIGIELWLTDHRSQSNIASLERVQRRRLLSQVRGLLLEQFPDSVARVRYETRLWIAHPLT